MVVVEGGGGGGEGRRSRGRRSTAGASAPVRRVARPPHMREIDSPGIATSYRALIESCDFSDFQHEIRGPLLARGIQLLDFADHGFSHK